METQPRLSTPSIMLVARSAG